MVGTTFANYSVIERLNHGGMSDVYLSTDSNNRRVVLRVLLPELRFRWKARRRFRWGCAVNRQLDHPNVERVFADGKFRGLRYSVLEYIDGPNLKECIIRADPQLRTNRLKLLTGMAAGLAYIHERGFIHLDFKPENVLTTKSYEPKIIDFDLAILRPARPKKAAKLAGTPVYLAPEQILRQPVDERADIFAFGLTAYEMLTGKKPITGNTLAEVIQKYAEFDKYLKPPRTHTPDILPGLERVILKCLEKDVTRRYPSMGLVVRDLQS
ncbi:MAG: serine/threonine-protein kinase [Verrucomicrobiota bacterium]